MLASRVMLVRPMPRFLSCCRREDGRRRAGLEAVEPVNDQITLTRRESAGLAMVNPATPRAGQAGRPGARVDLPSRAAAIDSPNVHRDAPSSTKSLSRNCPKGDSAGNPPAVGSPTPGVVNRKLNVARNCKEARALPTAEKRGSHGPRATRRAVMISTVPRTLDNARTLRASAIQLMNGLCVING